MELIIEGVSKLYRGKVWGLRGFSLKLGPGVLGLLGPNGAGKSTLMRILATVTRPTEGRALWNGADIVKSPNTVRFALGYLPQDFGVYPNLSAVEFLEYLAAVKGINASAARKRIVELLELVNLADASGRPLGGYSGGMRQRVGIAQALLNGPQFEISRGPLLTAAWIWPLLLWSALGVREARHGTEQLIFSAPRVLPRQLPAGWLVGVLIAAVTGVGVAARVLLARNYSGFLGWFAGALFIPTLALALGVWTGPSRPFEGLFTGLWYIGPLNHVPGFDFTGFANGAHTVKDASLYLAVTATLFIGALIGRRRQLRRG